ncbi:MAG: outer membrane beta-barrel protein, partial [Phaeodactylibacter sp.]|nr:outer membrane beta-barrel protein [Phaeodactylibacter sp.]
HVKGGVVPTMVTGVTEKQDFSFNKDDLNTFTMGANVGAGIDFLVFTLDANYEIGLNDFFKDAEGRNNMLTVSLGLKF